jgi:hypothetical protein
MDPREWLNRACSNLAMAKSEMEGVYLEDLCFDAQQAAEKAIKALLIKMGVEFPYIHDIAGKGWSGDPQRCKGSRGTDPVCNSHSLSRSGTTSQARRIRTGNSAS